jgi:hypothetical protein
MYFVIAEHVMLNLGTSTAIGSYYQDTDGEIAVNAGLAVASQWLQENACLPDEDVAVTVYSKHHWTGDMTRLARLVYHGNTCLTGMWFVRDGFMDDPAVMRLSDCRDLLSERNDTPQHKHDCARCTFLGRFKSADLYHCMQFGTMPTVIARYSSEGADYASGLPSAHTGNPDLLAAKERAAARGLPLENIV